MVITVRCSAGQLKLHQPRQTGDGRVTTPSTFYLLPRPLTRPELHLNLQLVTGSDCRPLSDTFIILFIGPQRVICYLQ